MPWVVSWEKRFAAQWAGHPKEAWLQTCYPELLPPDAWEEWRKWKAQQKRRK
jgi:hypothetical protein